MTVIITKFFDGAKFAKKFSITDADFSIKKNVLTCSSLPDLKESDIEDCIVDERKEDKRKGLKPLDMLEKDFRLFVLDQANIKLDENDIII